MNTMQTTNRSRWTFLGLGCALIIAACGPKHPDSASRTCDERAESIALLEASLFEETSEVQVDKRNALMIEYADFANACHDDVRTPEWLFRRADLLRSAGKFQEAMTQLRDVHDHYKDFDKRPVCAFLIGFIAEVDLNDREQAKTTYEQVIALHPTSDAAIWAQQSIEYLEFE